MPAGPFLGLGRLIWPGPPLEIKGNALISYSPPSDNSKDIEMICRNLGAWSFLRDRITARAADVNCPPDVVRIAYKVHLGMSRCDLSKWVSQSACVYTCSSCKSG